MRPVRSFRLVGIVVFALLVPRDIARADEWVRIDYRPWSYWEMKHAIHYCRVQQRVTDSSGVFINMVMGRHIDRCMYALGWVGAAR